MGRAEAAVVEAGDPSSRAGPRCASMCRNQPAWLCDRLQRDEGSWCRPRGVSGQGTPTRVGLWPVCVLPRAGGRLPRAWSVSLQDGRRYGWDRGRAGGGALVKVGELLSAVNELEGLGAGVSGGDARSQHLEGDSVHQGQKVSVATGTWVAEKRLENRVIGEEGGGEF